MQNHFHFDEISYGNFKILILAFIHRHQFFLFYKGIKVEKLFMSIIISLQGSRDNMSIIIIAFPGAPKVDPEAVRKEDELNKLIKQKVTG